MKKKIIFISEALWIGGIETALVNLLNRIDYDKYDVSVMIIKAELNLKDRINSKCRLVIVDREKKYSFNSQYRFAKLFHLTEHSDNPSILHRIFMWTVPVIRWIENRLYIKYIKEQMKNEQFDTAIIYSDRTAEITVRGIKAKKYLMFYHNAIMDMAYHDEIGYQASENIIAVSETKAEELKKFRPKYADKIMAIHNIVGIDEIVEKSKEAMDVSFQNDRFNIVTCGRLAHQKAFDWAIDACKILVEKGHTNVSWWVLGEGPDREKLQNQIKECGVENNFFLIGSRDNPYPFIANTDLYVQPSRYENYSVVILEAMALCKPILATKPAAAQQITDGINGKLCEDNPNSIADTIELLMNNTKECNRYVEYLKKHTLEDENVKILEKINSLV